LRESLCTDDKALVLIGPEGDFSIKEVVSAENHGFLPVSLGDSRLRTETAALVAVHIMNLFT
jgi:16S rRNA (uracil1498-N3)-methyltransferase